MKMPFNTIKTNFKTGLMACAVTALGNMAMADTISLGAPIPLTGYFAADGETMGQAINLAVSEINANGGLLDKDIEVLTFDIGDLTPDKLAAAAANLIERGGVSALINGYGGMGPDIPAFCPYGIPYIHNDAVAGVVDLAERMGCNAIFNASDIDLNYGKAQFDMVQKTGYAFDAKRIAIVHGDFEWDINNAKSMADAAEAAGWEVVYIQEVPYDTVEWTGIQSQIRAANPSLIHLEALEPAVATTFLSQYKENPAGAALLNVGYIGATSGLDDVMNQGQAEGLLSFTLNAHQDNEAGNAFVERWTAAYGAAPSVSLAAAVYDMVYMWAAAVEKVGDAADYEAVGNAIREMKFSGLVGTFAFNERNFINNGPDTQPAQLFQVQDGKRVRLVVGDVKVGEIATPSWVN